MEKDTTVLVGFQWSSGNHSDIGAEKDVGVLNAQSSESTFPILSYVHYIGFIVVVGFLLVASALVVYRVNAAARARRNEAEPGVAVSAGAQVKQQGYYKNSPTLANWGSPDTKWRKGKG